MKPMKKLLFAAFVSVMVIFMDIRVSDAQPIPEIFDEGSLEQQYDWIVERTSIYNNFRAIREDIFRKIRRNSLDSLQLAKREINGLKAEIRTRDKVVDSLKTTLTLTADERDVAIRDRDSLFLLGIPLNKTFYNLLLWSIIGGLTVFILAGFLITKKARYNSQQRMAELTELKAEYEDYKKSSRERFEKQSIDHFNEIKRLKGL